MERPETGSMRFGDDWTGVFIRGDCSFHYAMQLRVLLDPGQSPEMKEISRMMLQGLLDLLESSDERSAKAEQVLKPFPECVVSE